MMENLKGLCWTSGSANSNRARYLDMDRPKEEANFCGLFIKSYFLPGIFWLLCFACNIRCFDNFEEEQQHKNAGAFFLALLSCNVTFVIWTLCPSQPSACSLFSMLSNLSGSSGVLGRLMLSALVLAVLLLTAVIRFHPRRWKFEGQQQAVYIPLPSAEEIWVKERQSPTVMCCGDEGEELPMEIGREEAVCILMLKWCDALDIIASLAMEEGELAQPNARSECHQIWSQEEEGQ